MAKQTKRTAKKKASRKKASNKKSTKKSTKKRRRKSAAVVKREDPHPDRLETQIQVWEAFSRLRSARAVSRELGISDWIVRRVLHADRDRMLACIDEFMEKVAADWEQKHDRSQGIIDRLLMMWETLLIEIAQAAAEDRFTNIMDRDGCRLPVADAVQLITMSHMGDQVLKIQRQAHEVSTAYRVARMKGELPTAGAGGEDHEDFDKMDDVQLAETIAAAGMKLPPILARKVKMIQSKQVSKGV